MLIGLGHTDCLSSHRPSITFCSSNSLERSMLNVCPSYGDLGFDKTVEAGACEGTRQSQPVSRAEPRTDSSTGHSYH